MATTTSAMSAERVAAALAIVAAPPAADRAEEHDAPEDVGDDRDRTRGGDRHGHDADVVVADVRELVGDTPSSSSRFIFSAARW